MADGYKETAAFDNPVYREPVSSGGGKQPKMGKHSTCICGRKTLLVAIISVAAAIAAAVLITYYVSKSDCPGTVSTTDKPGTTPATPDVCPVQTLATPIRSICTLDNECPEDNIIRIPRDVLASHYHIEMKPDIYTASPDDFTFWGKVTIDMKCQRSTAYVQLNYNKFSIKDNTVKVTSQGQEVNVVTTWSNKTLDQDLYVIHLERHLKPGETIQVSMEYAGDIDKYPSSGRGYYYSDYKFNGIWKYMVTTQLESTFARELFPCMDDPSLKATFAMSIWRKSPYISLFNMPQDGATETKTNGWVVDHYLTTPVMSTYLVAFIVGEYSYVVSPSSHGHDIKIWAPVEYINNGWGNLSALVTGVALDFYDDLFKSRYQLPKLDIALVPDKGGAMENWGLVLSGMYAIMYDPDINGLNRERQLTSTMYHEEVHKWFGNLVTCDWWSDIWLNEAFATLYSYFPWKVTHPDWDMETLEEEWVYGNLYNEEIGARHAAHNPGVNTKGEAQAMFSTVSYGRTGNILRMMRKLVMSPEDWGNAMEIYLADNAYKPATYKQLLAAIDKFVDSSPKTYEIPPSEVLDTWIRQMGHPVVTITTIQGSTHVFAEQKLFMPYSDNPINDKENPSPFGYKWHIPIPYTTSFAPNNKDKKIVWLRKNDLDFDIENNMTDGSWILANYGHLGFYRINYDLDNWNALIKQLSDDHTVIPPENRAALIVDAFLLARAGELDISIALRLTTYLYKEKDYLPWVAIRWVNANFMEFYMSTMDSYGLFRLYMRWLLSPIYEDLGWDAKASETEKYINIVSPDTQIDIFCSAVHFDPTNATWMFVYQRWKEWQDEDIQEERLFYLLQATTCTRDKQLLQWMFDAALDSGSDMPNSGRSTILSGIARNPAGSNIVHTYLLLHWDDDNPYRELLLQIRKEQHNTHEMLHQVEMRAKILEIDVTNPSLYNSLTTRIERNLKFKEEFGSTIDAFLYNVTEHFRVRDTALGKLLPRNLYPALYDITLVPDIYHPHHDNFTSWGAVKIQFTAVNRTDVVFLNYKYIQINTDSVVVSSLTSDLAIHVDSVMMRPDDEYVAIFFDREVDYGENITVSMHFTDIMRANVTKYGLYWNHYHDKNLQPKYMLATQLQDTNARWVFPCIDEPGIKSHFTITMGRKVGYHSQSNMPIKRSSLVSVAWHLQMFADYGMDPTDWFMDEFETTNVVMQTYLVSLAVSDFTHEPCKDAKYDDSIWAQSKYVEAGYTNYAANVSAKINNFFEVLFDYDYPLPKQDSIVVPDRTGAMENWGLVTYAPYYMLYDPELSDVYDKVQIARVIGHELAHMWFGDLVTEKFQNDIFLHESYASFYENWAVEYVEPDWDMDQLFFRTRYLVAMKIDSYGITKPIRKDSTELDSTYSAILYSKGSCVLRMIEGLVMNKHWNETHQRYLEAHAKGNADMEDLLAIFDEIDMKYNLSEQVGVAPSLVLRTWLTQAGYPVIKFHLSPGSNKIRVTQKRFLLNPDKPTVEWYPTMYGYRWEVPLTFQTHIGGNENEEMKMMHQRDSIYTTNTNISTGDWILGNYDSKGFYRTNYETSNWMSIIQELKSSHKNFDVKVRAKLVDDALSLSRAGEMDQVLALSLLEYLEAEDEYAPWYAYSYSGDFLFRMLRSFKSWPIFQGHIRHLLSTAYNNLGWTVTLSESVPKRMARMHAMSLACRAGVSGCRSTASQLLADWKATPSDLSLIHPDLREAVYCTAIEDSSGVTEDWDFMFDRYLHFRAIDHFSRARTELVQALGCVKEKYIYQHFFEMAMDEDPALDSRDRYTAVNSVANNPEARDYVWNYLESNWDTMTWGENLLITLAGYFNTEAGYTKLQGFFAQHTVSEAVRSDINYDVLASIKWRKTNEQAIEEWLATVQTSK